MKMMRKMKGAALQTPAPFTHQHTHTHTLSQPSLLVSIYIRSKPSLEEGGGVLLGRSQRAVSQSVGSGAGTRVRKFLSSHSGVGCSRHLAAEAGAPQRMQTAASVERDDAKKR